MAYVKPVLQSEFNSHRTGVHTAKDTTVIITDLLSALSGKGEA